MVTGPLDVCLFFTFYVSRLHVCAPINDNDNQCYDSLVDIPENKWTDVEIQQKPEEIDNGTKYRYEVTVNNIRSASTINEKARTYHNVSVYVSDPWRRATNGYIRSFEIVPNIGSSERPSSGKKTGFFIWLVLFDNYHNRKPSFDVDAWYG